MGGKKKTDSGSLWLISNRPQSSPPPCKACWDIFLASRTTEQRVRYSRNKEQHSKFEERLRSFFLKICSSSCCLAYEGPCDGSSKGGALFPEARQLCLQTAEATCLDSHANGSLCAAVPLLHGSDMFAAGDMADPHGADHAGNKGECFSLFQN